MKIILPILVALSVVLVNCDPMMYVKNDKNLYEPGEMNWNSVERDANEVWTKSQKKNSSPTHAQFVDLVAVSSTVIPESELVGPESDDAIKAEIDLKYKKAVLSMFKKKYGTNLEKPDTLLTKNKKSWKFHVKHFTNSQFPQVPCCMDFLRWFLGNNRPLESSA